MEYLRGSTLAIVVDISRQALDGCVTTNDGSLIYRASRNAHQGRGIKLITTLPLCPSDRRDTVHCFSRSIATLQRYL